MLIELVSQYLNRKGICISCYGSSMNKQTIWFIDSYNMFVLVEDFKHLAKVFLIRDFKGTKHSTRQNILGVFESDVMNALSK